MSYTIPSCTGGITFSDSASILMRAGNFGPANGLLFASSVKRTLPLRKSFWEGMRTTKFGVWLNELPEARAKPATGRALCPTSWMRKDTAPHGPARAFGIRGIHRTAQAR